MSDQKVYEQISINKVKEMLAIRYFFEGTFSLMSVPPWRIKLRRVWTTWATTAGESLVRLALAISSGSSSCGEKGLSCCCCFLTRIWPKQLPKPERRRRSTAWSKSEKTFCERVKIFFSSLPLSFLMKNRVAKYHKSKTISSLSPQVSIEIEWLNTRNKTQQFIIFFDFFATPDLHDAAAAAGGSRKVVYCFMLAGKRPCAKVFLFPRWSL